MLVVVQYLQEAKAEKISNDVASSIKKGKTHPILTKLFNNKKLELKATKEIKKSGKELQIKNLSKQFKGKATDKFPELSIALASYSLFVAEKENKDPKLIAKNLNTKMQSMEVTEFVIQIIKLIIFIFIARFTYDIVTEFLDPDVTGVISLIAIAGIIMYRIIRKIVEVENKKEQERKNE